MKNLRIGIRLGLGFGLLLLIMIIVGFTGYWGVDKSTSATIHMIKGDASISEHAARARANVVGMRRYEKDLFLNIGDKAHGFLTVKLFAIGRYDSSRLLAPVLERVEAQVGKVRSVILPLDAEDAAHGRGPQSPSAAGRALVQTRSRRATSTSSRPPSASITSRSPPVSPTSRAGTP